MTMYDPTVDQRVDKALSNDFLRLAIRRATDRLRNNKAKAVEELGAWEKWREAGGTIRTHVVANLDFYLKQLITQIENRAGMFILQNPRRCCHLCEEHCAGA